MLPSCSIKECAKYQIDEQSRSLCTETWNCWPLSLTCNQEKYQVFPWWFQLEQLTEKMKSSPLDLLDFKATVSVLLYKKMEVKYLQCIWLCHEYSMLRAEPCPKSHNYHPWYCTLQSQGEYNSSNYKQFFRSCCRLKKKPFYCLSLFGEAII